MRTEGFFEWLGETLGAIIRFLVEGIGAFFASIGHAGSAFLDGLARALGMDPTWLSLLALIIGLLLLVHAGRALLRGSFIYGVLILLLGLWLLSLLIG